MQVVRWDPFTTLERLDRQFDELVRRSWNGSTTGAAGFVPAVEMATEDRDVVIRLELPGVDVERDVSIEVEPGRLVVSGERKDSREDRTDGLLVRELHYGSFRREFRLPDSVTGEQVEASYDAGMLEIRVRDVMRPDPEPTKVAIKSTGRRQVEPTHQTIDAEK